MLMIFITNTINIMLTITLTIGFAYDCERFIRVDSNIFLSCYPFMYVRMFFGNLNATFHVPIATIFSGPNENIEMTIFGS